MPRGENDLSDEGTLLVVRTFHSNRKAGVHGQFGGKRLLLGLGQGARREEDWFEGRSSLADALSA